MENRAEHEARACESGGRGQGFQDEREMGVLACPRLKGTHNECFNTGLLVRAQPVTGCLLSSCKPLCQQPLRAER
eukprot:1156551-Pelagomonas_calceolata.AAC.7